MTTYELYTIVDGSKTPVYTTTDREKAKQIYRYAPECRVAIDGEELLIHQSEAMFGFQTKLLHHPGYTRRRKVQK